MLSNLAALLISSFDFLFFSSHFLYAFCLVSLPLSHLVSVWLYLLSNTAFVIFSTSCCLMLEIFKKKKTAFSGALATLVQPHRYASPRPSIPWLQSTDQMPHCTDKLKGLQYLSLDSHPLHDVTQRWTVVTAGQESQDVHWKVSLETNTPQDANMLLIPISASQGRKIMYT